MATKQEDEETPCRWSKSEGPNKSHFPCSFWAPAQDGVERMCVKTDEKEQLVKNRKST